MNPEKITLEQASQIADSEIQRILRTAPELQGYRFSPTRFARENDSYWVFGAASEQLIEEGYIPGAVFACVDKKDGHLWNDAEHEQYARQREAHRTVQQTDAVAA
jgi:hypothetical protein